MLGMCYSWFARGTGKQFEVPTRRGSKGRINVMGTLSLFGNSEQLEVRELEGSCNQTQVIAYLETLAKSCNPKHLTVVVLDNAPFHKGEEIKKRRAVWEAKGLFLRYLPAYCPQLNLIESVWRKLKGFLMPRRCYDNLKQLQEAVRVSLKALNAITI